jgi:hypothetical protein
MRVFHFRELKLFCTASFILSLLTLTQCATVGYVEPKLPDLENNCRLGAVDPDSARKLLSGQGVRKSDYEKIADANKGCRDHLLQIVKYNYAAAEQNRPDDWKENGKDNIFGAALLAILEVLVYLAFL